MSCETLVPSEQERLAAIRSRFGDIMVVDALRCLGAAVGRDWAAEKKKLRELASKKDIHEPCRKLQGIEPTNAGCSILLTSCLPKMQFFTRTHPPRVCEDICKEHDADTSSTMCNYAQVEVGDAHEKRLTVDLMSLPRKMGGFALTQFFAVASADYVASLRATIDDPRRKAERHNVVVGPVKLAALRERLPPYVCIR